MDHEPTACWYCRHMASIEPATLIVACPKVGCMVKSRWGCSQFEREPGIDDDDWAPAAPMGAWKPVAPPQSRKSTGRDGWWTEPKRPARPAPPPAPLKFPLRIPPGMAYYLLGED